MKFIFLYILLIALVLTSAALGLIALVAHAHAS